MTGWTAALASSVRSWLRSAAAPGAGGAQAVEVLEAALIPGKVNS
ncbi:hypothetical protein MPTA5024_24575 [Microbispora sp. ATCC PTA-5024]|nr:hypothetical protein MPTA5024_24575 [Microbispora sp. ATCC PTA-5024]